MNESGDADLGGTRQQAIDALCEHFANDALSVEEFEKRVEQAHKAESSEELRKLLQDLPAGDLPIRREEISPAHPPRAEASVPSSRVKERAVMVANALITAQPDHDRLPAAVKGEAADINVE